MDLLKLLGFPFKGGEAIGEAFPGLADGLQSMADKAQGKSKAPARKASRIAAMPMQPLPYLDASGNPTWDASEAPGAKMDQGFRFGAGGQYQGGGGAEAGLFNGDTQLGQGWSQPLSVQPAHAPRPGAKWNGLQQSTSFDGNLQGGGMDGFNGVQGATGNPQGFDPLRAVRQLLGR